MARARARKTPKPKQPTYTRIERKADTHGVYAVLDHCLKSRDDLKEAHIACAFRNGWKSNKDGQLTLGKCKKVSELDKQFQGFDFIIILNFEAWTKHLNETQREALMFHELCHAAVAYDQNDNKKTDARGRTMYRIKRHDIEEFGDVVAKFGCYKQDLENFVATAMKSPKPPSPSLLDGFDENGAADGKGEAAVNEPEAAKETHVEKLANDRPVPKKAAAKPRGKKAA